MMPLFKSDAVLSLLIATFLVRLVPAIVASSSSLSDTTGNSKEAADVYYVTRMGDKFLGFTGKHEDAINAFGDAEQNRLETAILNAPSAHDKSLLETTARMSEENRFEAQNAFGEMRNFITSLKQAMGAVGTASKCQDLTCGGHAFCAVDRERGARCICKEGYEGNGFVCKTPTQPAVHAFMQFHPGSPRPQVADIQLSTIQGDTIMAVYRDVSNSHKGYAMLGHAGLDNMRWHAPILFSSQSQAFGPMLTQLKEDGGRQGGIAIAYRNANRGGDGFVLGGRVDPRSGIISFGTPKAFARHQAQGFALVPLAGSRVAIVFAEHLLRADGGQPAGGAMYGATMLLQMRSDGEAPEILSKDRFATGPVARLSATTLSPTTLVIAYRGDAEPGAEKAEAACVAGAVHRNHINFHSPAVLLEPDQTNIWARSLVRTGGDTVSYTYQSGREKVTKQAILRVDARTHRLELVQEPQVIAQGFHPVVGSVSSLPDADQSGKQKLGPFFLSLGERRRQQGSWLLTYVGHDGAKPAQARLCRTSNGGVPSGCRDLSWTGRSIRSVSGTEVSDGRFVFMFTDANGNPYYQFIGVKDPVI